MDHDGRSLGQPSRPGRLPPTKARQPTSPGGVGIEATASGQLIDLTQRHLHFRQIRQASQALVGRVDPAGDTRWLPGSANRSTPFTEKLGEPRKLIRVASAASATTLGADVYLLQVGLVQSPAEQRPRRRLIRAARHHEHFHIHDAQANQLRAG